MPPSAIRVILFQDELMHVEIHSRAHLEAFCCPILSAVLTLRVSQRRQRPHQLVNSVDARKGGELLLALAEIAQHIFAKTAELLLVLVDKLSPAVPMHDSRRVASERIHLPVGQPRRHKERTTRSICDEDGGRERLKLIAGSTVHRKEERQRRRRRRVELRHAAGRVPRASRRAAHLRSKFGNYTCGDTLPAPAQRMPPPVDSHVLFSSHSAVRARMRVMSTPAAIFTSLRNTRSTAL